jgi:hypothetical protein
MDDVDSPLRNPRPPPEPPAIQFIPATPSGHTPASEKQRQLGNFYEEMSSRPTRAFSLLRSLSKRRYLSHDASPAHTQKPGLLTRTFSISRSSKGKTAGDVAAQKGKALAAPAQPTPEDQPANESMLHPFWRPAYSDSFEDDDNQVYDDSEGRRRTYMYPPVDNRPRPPRRSLSSRMKRTFAILPIRNEYEDYYPSPSRDGVQRRTIRRTPSGRLRVIEYGGSDDSLQDPGQLPEYRPYTAPDEADRARRRLRPSNSLRKQTASGEADGDRKGLFFTSFGSKFDEYGLHSLHRRLRERRREKRSQELRQKISGPREVRDGVGDVIRPSGNRKILNETEHA